VYCSASSRSPISVRPTGSCLVCWSAMVQYGQFVVVEQSEPVGARHAHVSRRSLSQVRASAERVSPNNAKGARSNTLLQITADAHICRHGSGRCTRRRETNAPELAIGVVTSQPMHRRSAAAPPRPCRSGRRW
jgi:hypothetical protein